MCSTCNVSSTLFGISTQTKDAKLIHIAMTPKSITILANHAKNMARFVNVTVSLTSNISTKLFIQPSMSINRNTSLRLFGNGSMQFCGSPNDIEVLFGVAFQEGHTDRHLCVLVQHEADEGAGDVVFVQNRNLLQQLDTTTVLTTTPN